MSDDESVNVPVAPAEKRGRGAPKGKRTPTPAQLETLAKARHRAAEIRKHRTIIELEAAIEEKKASMPELTRFEPEIILPPNVPVSIETQKSWPVPYPAGEPPADLPNPCESIVTPNEMPKKRMTKIIIEQSESDSDEFESCDRVIFVKRKGREKKKDTALEPDVNVPVKQVNVNVNPYENTPVTKCKFTSHVEPNYFSRRFY
jgi:hypothetical protein